MDALSHCCYFFRFSRVNLKAERSNNETQKNNIYCIWSNAHKEGKMLLIVLQILIYATYWIQIYLKQNNSKEIYLTARSEAFPIG